MQVTRIRKGMLWTLVMVLLCTMLPVTMAAQTTLSVSFNGLRATSEGQWMTEPLTGTFEVWSGTTLLGQVTAHPQDGSADALALSSTEEITLRPVMETMPEGYLIQDAPISVSIAEGKENNPPVLVYADAGLFTVQGEVNASFAVLKLQQDEAGEETLEEVLTFSLDDTGNYILPQAIAAGDYVLRQLTAAPGRALGPDLPFQLVAYKGDADDILHLQVEGVTAYTATPIPQEAVTPTVTPDATPSPFVLSTTPVPTEAPTVTPEPADCVIRGTVRCGDAGVSGVTVTVQTGASAVTDDEGAFAIQGLTAGEYVLTFVPADGRYVIPAAVQTVRVGGDSPDAVDVFTDAQARGLLRLTASMPVAYVCQLSQGDTVAAEGQADEQGSLTLGNLEPGEYTLTLTLPQGMLLTELNHAATLQRGQAQWNVTLPGGQESAYQLAFTQGGAIAGTVSNLPDGTVVALSGEQEQLQATVAAGAYAFEELLPGSYTLSVSLPTGGTPAGEGWTGLDANGLRQATATVTVASGETLTVPELACISAAGVSGQVFIDANEDGALQAGETGVAGATVNLLDTTGAVYATTLTDGNGLWAFAGIPAGEWTVQVLPPDGVALLGQIGTSGISLTGLSDTLTLSGQDITGLSAAATAACTLEVNVFIDANTNGERGTYERRLSGVTLEAIRVLEDQEVVIATLSTNEEGEAVFSTLAPGTYKLRATLPDGYGFGKKGKEIRATSSIMEMSSELVQVSQEFTVTHETAAQVGIGVNTMAVVTGIVWMDENADGIWNEGEGVMPNVTVSLINEKDEQQVYTTQSGADGVYTLDQVRPGNYKLSFTCPEGWMFTRYSSTGGERRSIITTEGRRTASKSINLEAGETLDLQHVGMMREATVEGMAFLDANYNGLYDAGEAPLAGVDVEIYKSNGDLVGSALSAEDGSFRLTALRPNDYRLRVILPDDGSTFTTTVDASVTGNWLKARSGRRENSVDPLTLALGENKQVVVGAIYPGSITGTCYLDDNFSATMDEGEKVVSGLTVTLLDAEGNEVDKVKTSNKGVYTFKDLTPGTYQLSMQAKSGYAFTCLGQQNVMVNLTGGAGQSEPFFLALGENRQQMDAGMILPGTVQGSVFADSNDNGLLDEGEAGFAGAVVQLMGESGAVFEATLDETGAYLFDAVMPGRYYVRYELPGEAVFSSVQSGGNTLTGEGNVGASEWFDFATGQEVSMPLVGGLTLGSISGTTFIDQDGSGSLDAGDAPMAGVTLTLTPSRGDLEEITCTTGADGAFTLGQLHPDTYTLRVSFPDGLVLTRQTAFTLPLTPGRGEQSVSLAVAMGDRYENQLLGCVTPATVSGRLWLDENNDGRMGDGEKTPAGKQITVVDESTGLTFATLTTDETGTFVAEGLLPGEYTFSHALTENMLAAKTGDSTFQDDLTAIAQHVTVQAGEIRDDLRAGVVVYTSLGGTVWADLNGEIVPLAQVHLVLTDSNGTQLQVFDTLEDGQYRFDKLLPGDYYIAVTLPEGYLAVEPGDTRLADGSQVSILAQTNGRAGQSDTITLRMAEDQLSLDIGGVQPGSLGDLAWLDLDGDGWYDSAEPGLPGVTLRLIRNGETVAETTTDAYGYYMFDNLYPSTYSLEVTYPAEVQPTKPGTGLMTSLLPESEESVSTIEDIQVKSNAANRNVDIGFILREAGVYPAGIGDAPTQDWTKLTYGE